MVSWGGKQLSLRGSLFVYTSQIPSSRGGQLGKLRHAQGVLVHVGMLINCKLLAWRGPHAESHSQGGQPGRQGH